MEELPPCDETPVPMLTGRALITQAAITNTLTRRMVATMRHDRVSARK
ncbi:MAG: hypothetical protein Aurels2KO_36280 [Aureliella sp.]